MKILTNTQLNKLIEKNEEGLRNFYESKIQKLEEELEKAKDFKSILTKLSEKDYSFMGTGFNVTGGGSISFTEDVAIYVDDLLGGKVIKQEGTPCIRINSRGKVKEGLTKEKADEGFSYKLVRDARF